jgi:hypothetical protein
MGQLSSNTAEELYGINLTARQELKDEKPIRGFLQVNLYPTIPFLAHLNLVRQSL